VAFAGVFNQASISPMHLKLAYRNITAYKKRSIVTLLLTTITTALLVFITAWMDGSHSTILGCRKCKKEVFAAIF